MMISSLFWKITIVEDTFSSDRLSNAVWNKILKFAYILVVSGVDFTLDVFHQEKKSNGSHQLRNFFAQLGGAPFV